MCVVAEPRAVDLRSSHQFEEEIGAASSENRLFIAKMEFSVQTGGQESRRARVHAYKSGIDDGKQSHLESVADKLTLMHLAGPGYSGKVSAHGDEDGRLRNVWLIAGER